MTLAPERDPSPGDDPGPGPVAQFSTASTEPQVVRRVVRQRTVERRRRRKRLLVVQSLLTVAFIAGIAGLGYAGWRAALGITGGSGERVEDPAAPGYVAEVRPTSVSMIAFEYYPFGPVDAPPDPSGEAMPEDEGRALMAMLLVVQRSGGQPTTIVPLPDATMLWEFDDVAAQTATEVYATGGTDVLSLRLGASLSFGATEALTLPADAIVAMAASVGGVTIDLPDDVLQRSADDMTEFEIRWHSGELTLQPEEIPEFLDKQGELESVSNFAIRIELVWEALIDAMVAGGGVPVAELESLGDQGERFAEIMSDSLDTEPAITSVPYATGTDGSHLDAFAEGIDTAAMPSWVAQYVPFPTSAYPGQRVKVELLNGTNDPEIVRVVAPSVVEANGEIAWTGNAESFDVAASRVEYPRPEYKPAADAIAAALGLTATENAELSTHAEVVVVVGADRL